MDGWSAVEMCKDGWMMNEKVDRQTLDSWMDEGMDGQVHDDGWIDEGAQKQIDGLTNA